MPHDRPGTLVFKCFVVAEFLLTSASRGPSAIAELLVYAVVLARTVSSSTSTRTIQNYSSN